MTEYSIAFVSMCCAVIQTAVVCVTMVWLVRQTQSAADGVKEAVRAIRVSVHNSTADAVNDINELILGDEALLQANKESKPEVLRHIFFNRFEQLHTLHREGLMDSESWESTQRWVSHKMADPDIRKTWLDAKQYFRYDFVEWIDALVLKAKTNSNA